MYVTAVMCAECRHVTVWTLVKTQIHVQCAARTSEQRSVACVCWCDCKPEGPLFSAEFVCLSVCLSVSDRHFYPSALTDFDETCHKDSTLI